MTAVTQQAAINLSIAERQRVIAAVRSDLFGLQREVFDANERWVSVLCGRRAGKTVCLAAMLFGAACEAGADEAVVYLAKTRTGAKDIVWGKLRALLKRLDLEAEGWRIGEQELSITTPWGAIICVRGAKGSDHAETMDKLRGLKIRLAVLDETATYEDVLEGLVRNVLEPALGDVRGKIVVTGTPGVVCAGWWYEVSSGARKKWRRFHWTVRENPFFRDAEAFLGETLEENGWTEDNPTYQREYLGRWFVDDEDRVYRYLDDRNSYAGLPAGYDPNRWVHVLGVDFGTTNDACAWSVITSHPHRKESFTLESFKKHGLDPDQAAVVTQGLIDRYKPDRIAVDAGGLGAAYVAAFRSRYDLPLTPAEKSDKRAHIELLNGDLRAGRHSICRDTCQDLRSEVVILPWADVQRLKEHARYANDAADSWLYAYWAHRSYLHEKPAAKVHTLSRADSPEVIELEEQRYREQATREWWDQ